MNLGIIFPEGPKVIESSHFHIESVFLDLLFLYRLIRQSKDQPRCWLLSLLPIDLISLETHRFSVRLSLLLNVKQLDLCGVGKKLVKTAMFLVGLDNGPYGRVLHSEVQPNLPWIHAMRVVQMQYI